jgi:glycosyltransferase involved in cell wall biosynthesis
MRLALVIFGTLDTVSGGYLYDRKLVRHLRDSGDEVEIVSLPWRNYSRHLAQNFSREIGVGLKQLRVDAILQDELNHPSLFLLNRSLRERFPIVSIVHHLRCDESHPPVSRSIYRRVERAYLQTCDVFVFNSETTRRSVERLSGETKPSVVAYPAGDRFVCDIHHRSQFVLSVAERIRRMSQAYSGLRLLFVGNIIPRKGLHTLFESAAKMVGEWSLDVVGSLDVQPRYVNYLRSVSKKNGIAERIFWHGKLTDDLLAEKFAECDVLVGVSQYEGFGISYLEAMSFGLPVIASTAGAASEIVTDGVNGVLVPPEDVFALTNVLTRMQHDRAWLAAMSLAARERFEQHPTWRETCDRIRSFLLTQVR